MLSLLLLDLEWWLSFARPICLAFFVLTFIGLCGPFIFDRLQRRWQS